MARDKDDLYKLARASFAGPTAAGQELAVNIPLGSRRPTIEGRFVHEDGTPCIRSQIVWRPHYLSRDEASPDGEETWGIRREFMTDDAGLFCVPLDVSLLLESKITFHFLLWSAARGNVGPAGPGASVRLERIQKGSNPVGELSLEPAELLVSGRVVDGEGMPVAGATLVLEATPELGPHLLHPTDEGGRFAIRLHDAPEAFFLTAHKPGHVPARSRDLEPGAADVVLTLEPGATLTGSVLLDEGIPPALILVELATEPARVSHADPIKTLLDAGYRFEFAGLHSGPRTLSLRLRLPGLRVVRTLERIPVRAGEMTADSRLRVIDLRGGIPVAILTFLDERGQRIGALPGVQAVDSDGEIVDVFREPGIAVFAGKLPAAVRVQIPGFREWVQSEADGIRSRRVTLRRARPFLVRLQMPATPELADPNIRVRVGLEKVDSGFDEYRDKFFFVGRTALLDDVGSCSLQVPEPGIYSLALRARHYKIGSATWSGEREFTPASPARIDLRKKPGGETVAVILEVAELRKFLQRLRN